MWRDVWQQTNWPTSCHGTRRRRKNSCNQVRRSIAIETTLLEQFLNAVTNTERNERIICTSRLWCQLLRNTVCTKCHFENVTFINRTCQNVMICIKQSQIPLEKNPGSPIRSTGVSLDCVLNSQILSNPYQTFLYTPVSDWTITRITLLSLFEVAFMILSSDQMISRINVDFWFANRCVGRCMVVLTKIHGRA